MWKRFMLFFIGLFTLEVVVLLYVGQQLGVWQTLTLIVITSACGVYFAKREGNKVWQQFQMRLSTMDAPGVALIDRMLIGIAGVLLILPGFITDGVGFVLLVPYIRKKMYPLFMKKMMKSVEKDKIIIIENKNLK